MTKNDRQSLRFDGRVAVVTGAGRGIGREYALHFARRGANVLVNDLGGHIDGTGSSGLPAREVVEAIRAEGGVAEADVNSAATREGCEAIIASAIRHFGRVDVLVCNAGGGGGAWLPMLDLNLSGAWWLCNAAWPYMKAQRYGRIVTTTSAAGLFGLRSPNRDGLEFFAYGTAKMGVVGLTRNLALEGATSNVRVNCVSPVALSRMSSQVPNPETIKWLERNFPARHVAHAVLCLAHELCEVSGEVYSVGGGRIARIVIAETEGVCAPRAEPEELMDCFKETVNSGDLLMPRTTDEEMSIYTRQLRTPDAPAWRVPALASGESK